MPPFLDEMTARVRESKFGREILGPKVAQPLASWLENNLVEAPLNQALDSAAPDEPEVAELADLDLPAPAPASAPAPAESVLGALSEPSPADGDESVVEGPENLLGRLKQLPARIKQHNLVVVAAGIAFWGLLAIPATLFAVVSIAGLLLDPETVEDQVESNLTGLPTEARKIIGEQLASVSGGSTGGLITGVAVGLLLALWTSSGAMAKLMAALNTIFDTDEGRNFPKLRGLALVLTFGGIVFVAAAIFLLAALPAILSNVDFVGDSAATLFVWLRFPLLGLVMVLGLAVLYHLGPDRETRYRPITGGAIVATLLWVGLSALFTIYTATAGSYNETYGSIGGVVVLLLWLFITAFVVLLGAEVDAQR